MVQRSCTCFARMSVSQYQQQEYSAVGGCIYRETCRELNTHLLLLYIHMYVYNITNPLLILSCLWKHIYLIFSFLFVFYSPLVGNGHPFNMTYFILFFIFLVFIAILFIFLRFLSFIHAPFFILFFFLLYCNADVGEEIIITSHAFQYFVRS